MSITPRYFIDTILLKFMMLTSNKKLSKRITIVLCILSLGRCDLKMRGGATSAASCCSFCSTTPKCKAFTYLSGTCHMKNCNDVTLNSNGMVVEGSVSGFSIY